MSTVDIAAVGAVAVAGTAFIAVQWLVSAVLVPVVEKGAHLKLLLEQELQDTAPVNAALILAGALTALLYDRFGLVGLVPLAVMVIAPRALAPRLVPSRDPGELEQPEAISLYARALAEVLSLDADQRRIVADAATHLGGAKRLTRIDDFQRVMQTVLYCHERWNGERGFPGVLRGEAIPIESRVLAVAEALGSLTARGTRGLTPDHAVSTLVARAGAEFDPRVIAAARRVIDEDILISPRPAAARGTLPRELRSRSAGG